MQTLAQQLTANVKRVRDRIRAACDRAHRQPDAVQLVAVTKYAAPHIVQALVDAGTTNLGESRPQRLWELTAAIKGEVQWHLIGHLQRNKVAKTLPLVTLIHSVDSERLLTAIDQEAAKLGIVARCLLEVNISGDSSKHGWAPADMQRALECASRYDSVKILGLMTMAAREGGTERAASDFQQMHDLRQSLISNCPENVELGELSMGMSGDYEAAIEHGATIVRVGSALFEGT